MFQSISEIPFLGSSCLSTYRSYPHHCYAYTQTLTTYDTFSNLDLTFDDTSLRSIWHLYYFAIGCKTHNSGHKTHNPGRMTHNPGRMTHKHGLMTHNIACSGYTTQNNSCALSIQCHYCPMPSCMTSVSSKWQHNVTACYRITDKSFYLFHQLECHNMSTPCKLSKKTENQCSKSVTFSVYVFLLHSSNSQFRQKLQKQYKCSALPLFLAINRCIYYLLNGTFNQASDVNHLINRLLLMLQQYIIRHNDFKHYWFTLLLSGLLRSQYISLWFLLVLYFSICILAQKLFWFQKYKYIMNFIVVYTVNLMINKIVVLSSCLHFICFWTCNKFITLCHPSILLASDQNIKSTTGFVGGGSSARTDYNFLKPYVLSTEIQLKNPDEFNYIYGSHCTFDSAMQEIRTSGEAQLVCNVPLTLVASILTSTQVNQVAREHNLHSLSRKSLAEKRTAVESHVCTVTCNRCVTVFKPVKKNQKNQKILQQKGSMKVKEMNNHPKVGKKLWRKPARAITNHKYYARENVKFPPSPPSKRLMHKIITGFCNDTDSSKFEEAGCAVCGQLVVITKLAKLTDLKCSLDPLVRIGVTRLPRSSADDPVKEVEGPIIDASCEHVCHECVNFLEKKAMPPMALANGLWVGDVPKEC